MREMLLPAPFGDLVGQEPSLDPKFLQGDVLRPAESVVAVVDGPNKLDASAKRTTTRPPFALT
jgi:hypothetical protein